MLNLKRAGIAFPLVAAVLLPATASATSAPRTAIVSDARPNTELILRTLTGPDGRLSAK